MLIYIIYAIASDVVACGLLQLHVSVTFSTSQAVRITIVVTYSCFSNRFSNHCSTIRTSTDVICNYEVALATITQLPKCQYLAIHFAPFTLASIGGNCCDMRLNAVIILAI